jgi:hypothetical protein
MGEKSIQKCLDLPKGAPKKIHMFPYIPTRFSAGFPIGNLKDTLSNPERDHTYVG